MADSPATASRQSRVLILRLALRAIRWRAAASATVFVVAVVAVLAATVGPIYLHAVDQAVLTRHLHDAGLDQRNVLVSRNTEQGFPGVDWSSQVHAIAGQFAPSHLFAAPLAEEQVNVIYGGPEPLKTELAAVADLCVHVRIISGHCLSGDSTGATVISANTAAAEHLHVGSTLVTNTNPLGVLLRLRVLGVYRPIVPNGAFWQPWGLFQFGQPTPENQPPSGDASFVSSAAIASWLQRTPVTLSANVALLPGAVRYGEIAELRRTIAHADATAARFYYLAGSSGTPVASVSTGLPTILDQTATETSLAATLVTVATAQLALLAVLLLYAVVANTTAAQGPEVALAKLRGRSSGSVLLQSLAQPITLVIAAAPVGALLAWLLVRLFAAGLLGHRVDVTFPPAAYGVAALGVLGGVLAAVIAARRIVVTPVGALMRLGADTSASPTGLLVADAAMVTIAVAGLIELKAGGVLNSGKPNPLSVVAPTLLAVAAAVIVLRLLPFPARRLARWTRDSPRLVTFLVVRQLLRRPAEARAVLLVAVAVSIATFAVATWSDSGNNRRLRALNSAGAYTVLDVRPGPGVHDLRTAVDRADPAGHSMAVAYTDVGNIPPLIAVDTARFGAVGAWVPANSAVPLAAVLNRLRARVAPVVFSGTQLRLRIDLLTHPKQTVQLAVKLTTPNHRQATRTVSVLPGTRSYEVSLPPACAGGCSLAGLDLTANTPNNTVEAEIAAVIGASVRGGGGWQSVPGFGERSRWRGVEGPVQLTDAAQALSVTVREPYGYGWPSVVSAAIPSVVPAVIGSAQAVLEEGNEIHNIEAVGLDRQSLFVNGEIQAVTLPQVGRSGLMVDFGAALEAMDRASARVTQYQVWMSSQAPTDMATRLARQHVYVQRTIHASSYRASLDDSGPAYADELFLLSALAAGVLAIGATAVGRVLSVRRRSYELAALEAVGIAPRTLRRATAAEQGSVFGIGLLVGLAAGIVGSGLALPSTPVFVDTTTGPPLELRLPWLLLAALVAGTIVVFVLVSLGIARVVDRAAAPSQLRAAQQ